MNRNECINCRYYEKCGKPSRPIKCMGYEKGDDRDETTREDMSLPQILEDIHDRICDEYCKWPLQYPLATDDEAYNRMGEEHCDKCPVRRLT